MLNRTSGGLTAILLAMLLLLLGSGCTKAEKVQEVVTQDVERHITVEVDGARQARYEGRHKLKVITRIGKKEQKPNSVAAIEPLDQLDIGDGVSLRPQIAVVGQYEGDGTYTTPAGVGPAPTTGPTVPGLGGSPIATSVAAVVFVKLQPTPSEERFAYVLEPCTVKLDDGATVGSVDCPALVAHNGEKISMRYSWKK